MPVQPSMKVLRAFLKFQTLVIMPMMMAEMEARRRRYPAPAGSCRWPGTKDAIGLDVTGVEQAHEDEHQQQR